MKAQVLALSRRLQSRIRTQWRPLSITLRPETLQAAPGQWMPAIEGALSNWGQWCGEHAGVCADVSLSSHWLLVAVADEPVTAWQHYYGIGTDELQRDWVLRHVRVGASTLHCAAPRALIDGLQSAAKAHGVQVLWAGPWWIRDLERHVSEQMQSSERCDAWSAQEPGLSIHASLSWPETPKRQVELHQLWCEAEAA